MPAHPSGLPFATDRIAGRQDVQSLVFHGKRPYLNRTDLQDIQSVFNGKLVRHGALVAKDGDRIERAFARVNIDAGTVSLTDGKIYLRGDVFPVAAAELEDVPMEGRIDIGVVLTTVYVTADDDDTLVGQVPGSLAEGEPGAAQERGTIAWAVGGGALEPNQSFFSVYLLQDGTLLDQALPPSLDRVRQMIASDQAHWGQYIVAGCRVTFLGNVADDQVFAIEEGEARVNGFALRREASLRHAQPIAWDTQAIPGETHTYPGGGSHTFTVDQVPIDAVSSVLLTKQKTVTLNRGGVPHTTDALPDTSVLELIEVKQGVTTYTIGVDVKRTGNTVDWDGPGLEPAGGSSYDVTYRYRASVAPDTITDTTITVSGGATGGDIIVSYTRKLPRIDLLCLNQIGAPVYVRGVSAAANPMRPQPPADLLPLALIANDWMGPPEIANSRVRNVTIQDIQELIDLAGNLTRLVMVERGRHAIDARDPASYRGMFVDPLQDDDLRDEGEAQTATVADGLIQLTVTPSFHVAELAEAVTLPWVEEVVAEQPLATKCVKINPFANFTPLPGKMVLTPPTDFWAESREEWASPVTREFNRGAARPNAPLTSVQASSQLLGQHSEQVEFLRQREVAYRIEGFGSGEELIGLTFDGVDVLDGDPEADVNGVVEGSLIIPADQTAGTKTVRALGEGGTRAQALFSGGGVINVTTMRRVVTINRWTRPPVVTVARPTTPEPEPEPLAWLGGEQSGNAAADPQAQVFALDVTRQLLGVDIKLCHIGEPTNAILIHQVGVVGNTIELAPVAEAFVPMTDAELGWVAARYDLPATTESGRQHAFVVKTDDADHSISAAKTGQRDQEADRFITSHPYVLGQRAESVNASQYNFVLDEALTFRVVAARYTATERVVDLGEIDLVDCSDLQVRATVDLPSAACSVVFEVERTNGTIYRLLPYQVLQLTEYLTETVQLRAVLKGTALLSPILYPPVMLVAGTIAEEGTYVSRAFDFGTSVDLVAYFKAFLPAGATATFEYDEADDDWQLLAPAETTALGMAGWVERKFTDDGITALKGRIRVTIEGGPAARVLVGDLGAGIKQEAI